MPACFLARRPSATIPGRGGDDAAASPARPKSNTSPIAGTIWKAGSRLPAGRPGCRCRSFCRRPSFSSRACIRSRRRWSTARSRIAGELDAKLFVVASKSGVTAIARSKRRGAVPTVGLSDDPATLRQMALYWGVTPLAAVATHDTSAILEHVTAWGLREGRLERGDRILLVAGSGFGTGGRNTGFGPRGVENHEAEMCVGVFRRARYVGHPGLAHRAGV